MQFEHIEKKLNDTVNIDQVDLRSITQLVRSKSTVPILDFFQITDISTMKIDLIAKKYYGTSDDAWIILKFNSISNPMAIPVGKVLIIPEKESFIASLKEINVQSSSRRFVASTTPPSTNNTANARSIMANRSNTFNVNNGTLTI